MDEIELQVLECFASVFPDMARDALPALRQELDDRWDSVAHATLIATLNEALGIELDFEAFAEATSFERVLELVRASSGRAG